MTGFDTPSPLLPEIFALHGRWRADREALVCGQQRLNWSQFCAANHQFAHTIAALGAVPGDRVGVLMSNGLPMVQVLFGCMAAGAASVPINLSVTDSGMAGMLRDAQVRLVVVTADQWRRASAIRKLLPDLQCHWLCADAPPEAEAAGWLSLASLCNGQPTHLPEVQRGGDLPLNIIYSSGTTGLPKGILHTQRGRRDWASDLAIALRYHGAARTLVTIGLYSNISWVAMLCTLLAGGCIVVHDSFHAGAFLDTVQAERITHTAMVPIQYQRVLDQMQQQPVDVSSMQSMMSCGSPLHEGLKRALFAAFPCGVIELYGLTEGIITTLDPEDAEGRWSSVGKPLLGTDLRIVDDDDQLKPVGQAGEIVSRGRITMPGYWQRPDENADAEFIDAQGVQWLRSGDIGYIDEQGYLYIVDRKKDMILSGGQNIYPQDIEALLVQHPQVDDVAVIGAASRRWGETPVALVVSRNPELDRDDLLQWANQRLGRQQRLAEVKLLEMLPRNPNGKVLKRELREQYRELGYD